MAKSARARVTRVNHAKLRERVFGPAEHARLQRMEKKLMDLAAQPKPERPDRMEVDSAVQSNEKQVNHSNLDEDVDMDQDAAPSKAGDKKGNGSKKSTRVSKRKQRKGSTSILFPTQKKKRKVASKGRK